MRTFYKTVMQIEILSKNPIPDTMSLKEIAHEATDGEYSMQYSSVSQDELTGKQAADELIKQGSSPGFFMLDDDGNDIDL